MKITEKHLYELLKDAEVYKQFCMDCAQLAVQYRNIGYTVTVPFSICLGLKPLVYLSYNIVIYRGFTRVENPEIIDLDRWLQHSFEVDVACDKYFKEAIKAIYT